MVLHKARPTFIGFRAIRTILEVRSRDTLRREARVSRNIACLRFGIRLKPSVANLLVFGIEREPAGSIRSHRSVPRGAASPVAAVTPQGIQDGRRVLTSPSKRHGAPSWCAGPDSLKGGSPIVCSPRGPLEFTSKSAPHVQALFQQWWLRGDMLPWSFQPGPSCSSWTSAEAAPWEAPVGLTDRLPGSP